MYRVGILTNKATDPAEARLWQAFPIRIQRAGEIIEHGGLISYGRNLAKSFKRAATYVDKS